MIFVVVIITMQWSYLTVAELTVIIHRFCQSFLDLCSPKAESELISMFVEEYPKAERIY